MPSGSETTGLAPAGAYTLTPELAEQLIAAARSGLFKQDCAICVGISPDTLDMWLRMGLSPEAVNPYLDFARIFCAQESAAQLPYVNSWRSAAMVDWRAASAWLATRNPDAWGPRATKNAQAASLRTTADDSAAEEEMCRQLIAARPPILVRLLAEAGVHWPETSDGQNTR